ncbi:MAG: phytanoyl-CoA dioxygenase family protein [Methylophilaceae bacterium]|nr:phytanoyl-CoA dioxygenase family protein [Methyloradius sp.]
MTNQQRELAQNGYCHWPQYFDSDYIEQLAAAIDDSYKVCRHIQIKNEIEAVTDGTVHHLLATGDPIYLDLLDKLSQSRLYGFMKEYFQGNFILNGYGGVINLPNKPSYVANIHRDIRFFSGEFPLMLNCLIMLDDFTLENGATYLLAGSHLHPDKPESEAFYKSSDRAIGKKGDIVFFNSNLWHAAGINLTQLSRRAITITFAKPFMKQQLDYPRCVGYDKQQQLTSNLQQILGYFSRTPSNLDEWYQKPEYRFYKPGQDN